jgi:hypothetical protein
MFRMVMIVDPGDGTAADDDEVTQQLTSVAVATSPLDGINHPLLNVHFNSTILQYKKNWGISLE